MNAVQEIFGASTSASAASTPKKELGQEDFLKLLVAQLQNQDPNNPADNGEFLGQIAQFSMVSGIDDLGASFDGIAGSLYSSQAMQAVGLVGKQVLAETDVARLIEGESVEGMIALYSPVEGMKIEVLDDAGNVVRSINMGQVEAGLHHFSWDGLDEAGNQSASGDYIIRTQALVNGNQEAVPFQLYSDVESVSVDRASSGVILHLANDKNVGLSQVTQYR